MGVTEEVQSAGRVWLLYREEEYDWSELQSAHASELSVDLAARDIMMSMPGGWEMAFDDSGERVWRSGTAFVRHCPVDLLDIKFDRLSADAPEVIYAHQDDLRTLVRLSNGVELVLDAVDDDWRAYAGSQPRGEEFVTEILDTPSLDRAVEFLMAAYRRAARTKQ